MQQNLLQTNSFQWYKQYKSHTSEDFSLTSWQMSTAARESAYRGEVVEVDLVTIEIKTTNPKYTDRLTKSQTRDSSQDSCLLLLYSLFCFTHCPPFHSNIDIMIPVKKDFMKRVLTSPLLNQLMSHYSQLFLTLRFFFNFKEGIWPKSSEL